MMTSPRPFVVLHHTGYGEPHYDLMLATDEEGPLLTWRCPEWPLADGQRATALPAHRRAYLAYEGDVSGGRGQVRRVAAGHYTLTSGTAAELVISLEGRTLRLFRS